MAAAAPLKAPRHRNFGAFVHVKARFYQNYRAMVLRAAKRRRGRAVDIDGQPLQGGISAAAHWPTLGKNKLHDPKGVYGKSTPLDTLTPAEFLRMRGPKGQKPILMGQALRLAAAHGVRVELEAKRTISLAEYKRLLSFPAIAAMVKRGHLQVKTLAFMGAPNGPVNRLRPAHQAGIPTILSFTDFRKRGISKAAAWPVTDYVRGRAKWIP